MLMKEISRVFLGILYLPLLTAGVALAERDKSPSTVQDEMPPDKEPSFMPKHPCLQLFSHETQP
jgi:hypothetical protein